MAKSGISKHIHSQNVTVLAPVDKAFEIFPKFKQLLLPENEALLNEFISYHVIDIAMEYKEFTLEDTCCPIIDYDLANISETK